MRVVVEDDVFAAPEHALHLYSLLALALDGRHYLVVDRAGSGFSYPLHDPRIDLMIWAEQTGVHGRHDGGVVGACIGMACERKELDGLL